MRKTLSAVFIFSVVTLFIVILAPQTVKARGNDQGTFDNGAEIVTEGENALIQSSSSGGDGSKNEDWYDLSVENGVPQLPHTVDYSTKEGLINYLKPGDLVYEPVGGVGITGHTAMVYDIMYSEKYSQYYVVLIEAVSDGVSYGLLTPQDLLKKNVK